MRFAEVFRYEFGYRVRSASTWLYGAFLLLLSFWIVHVSVTGTNPLWVNGPQQLAQTTALFCGLFGMLVTAGLFSDAALRDRAVGMDPLLFSSRLRPAEYLGGRFLAALAINAILVFAVPTGLALGAMMPYLPRDAFGPIRAAAYLQPVLLFQLPNLVLIGAILFTIAALTRHVVPVYLGAIAIFIGYIVASNYWGDITSPLLATVADPLGINALKGMTEYWTASESNTRLVGFPAMLLWNRLVWLAIAMSVLGVLLRTFRFQVRERRGGTKETYDAPTETRWTGIVPQVTTRFGARTRVRQVLAIARQSLREVVSGRAFQVAFVAAIGLVLLWGWNVGATVYETITWPVTHLVAGVVLAQRAIAIPWLVIALYAGELVWKDRETGAAEIADAVPVRIGTAILGRFLALVALIAAFQFAFLLGGILLQVLQGYYQFELGLYLQILFGVKFVDYVLLAALAMTVHVLVNHKYVGHVLVLLLIIFTSAATYGLHHLFLYNSGPAWMYSEMNGFAPYVRSFVWFKLYWAAWALLLGVVAFLFWVRGPESGIRQRLATARQRFTGSAARLAGVAALLVMATGGYIYYNTNVLNERVPPHRAGEPQAEHERLYGRYRDLPQPVITAANLRVELYPDETAFDMTGTYQLVNRTAAAIRDVHIETPRAAAGHKVRSMTFDRAAKLQLDDAERGYRIFTLEAPLAPGESMQFRFDVSHRPRGFPHGGGHTKIVGNGTYFDRMLMPFIGYQPLEVTDDAQRAKFGLPGKRGMPSPRDAGAGRYQSPVRAGERVHVEAIVGTAADQTVVVPAMLRRSWTENGRRYFHYATRNPEIFTTAVFSARYAVHEGKWRDVLLQVFHHPPHRQNRERMVKAMQSALGYYTKEFGPYPYRELRIVEVPPYSIHGRAFPSAVGFAEQNFITRTGPDVVDLTYFGTAHEVAHQWWGGQVRPAYAMGRGFVSEALSNYSAMMVVETVLGPTEARRVYDYQMDRYLRRRGETGRDVPLLEVDDHPHVAYGKGAVAMYTLREQLGTEVVHAAMRNFLAKYGRPGPPYATSLDLYAELRAVTPASHQALLTDLFETITLWNVETRRATTRRLPDGMHEVTLEVVAQKVRANGSGVETPTPMNDLIEVAVFSAGRETAVYKVPHRIRSGKQTIRIVVSQEPSRAGLDPDGKLIERERGNNVVGVEGAARK